ncbi:MAG: ASCH domain-containing protein [Alkalibacterium sp.]|nr:ASCH domain-containing protein [Alkalibacterium sp.]
MPHVNEFSRVLDSCDESVCIIKTTKVSIVPFLEVFEEHSFKEVSSSNKL